MAPIPNLAKSRRIALSPTSDRTTTPLSERTTKTIKTSKKQLIPNDNNNNNRSSKKQLLPPSSKNLASFFEPPASTSTTPTPSAPTSTAPTSSTPTSTAPTSSTPTSTAPTPPPSDGKRTLALQHQVNKRIKLLQPSVNDDELVVEETQQPFEDSHPQPLTTSVSESPEPAISHHKPQTIDLDAIKRRTEEVLPSMVVTPVPTSTGSSTSFAVIDAVKDAVESAEHNSIAWIMSKVQRVQPNVSKNEIKRLLQAMAIKEKREGDPRAHWHIRLDVDLADIASQRASTAKKKLPSTSTPTKKGNNISLITPVKKNAQPTASATTPKTAKTTTPKPTTPQLKSKAELMSIPQYKEHATLLDALLKRVDQLAIELPDGCTSIESTELVQGWLKTWLDAHKNQSHPLVEFPDDSESLTLLASLVQGRWETLADLVASVDAGLGQTIATEVLKNKVQLLAERKAYGIKERNVVVASDTNERSVWRWEVQNLDLFPKPLKNPIVKLRKERRNLSQYISCVNRYLLLWAQRETPSQQLKIEQEKEKILRYQRAEEVQRQKRLDQEEKERQRELQRLEKERQKEHARLEKEQQRINREEKKASEAKLAAERKAAEEQEQNKPSLSLMKFFVKPEDDPQADRHEGGLASSQGSANPDPSSNSALEEQRAAFFDALKVEIDVDAVKATLLTTFSKSCAGYRGKRRDTEKRRQIAILRKEQLAAAKKNKELAKASAATPAESWGNLVEPENDESVKFDVEIAALTTKKLFQFHENQRPPYFGTFRKRSKLASGRAPWRQEEDMEYGIDSDDEWEEEDEEEGESLSDLDNDEEDDGRDKELDYNDGWLMADDAVIVSGDEDEDEDDEQVGGGNRLKKRCHVSQNTTGSFRPVILGVNFDPNVIVKPSIAHRQSEEHQQQAIKTPEGNIQAFSKVITIPPTYNYEVLRSYKVQCLSTPLKARSVAELNAAVHTSKKPESPKKAKVEADGKENGKAGEGAGSKSKNGRNSKSNKKTNTKASKKDGDSKANGKKATSKTGKKASNKAGKAESSKSGKGDSSKTGKKTPNKTGKKAPNKTAKKASNKTSKQTNTASNDNATEQQSPGAPVASDDGKHAGKKRSVLHVVTATSTPTKTTSGGESASNTAVQQPDVAVTTPTHKTSATERPGSAKKAKISTPKSATKSRNLMSLLQKMGATTTPTRVPGPSAS